MKRAEFGRVSFAADPGRQRRRLVVVRESGPRAAGRTAASQPERPRREHQPEEEPEQKTARNLGGWTLRREAQPPRGRGEENREKTRLEQQGIPLVSQKHLPDRGER